MNTIWRILKMPWIATIKSPLGWLSAFVWLMLVMNVARATPIKGIGWRLGAMALVMAVVVVWTFVANTLCFTRDAHTLRVPGVKRDATLVPLCFALLSVVAPALIVGALFGHTVTWLVTLALVAALILAYHTLPILVSIPLFLGGFMAILSGWWRPPLPGNPHFLALAVPTVILLVVVSAQRWAAMLRAYPLASGRWLRPGIWNLRVTRLRKLGVQVTDRASTRNAADQRKPAGTLRNVGPAHGVRSIRVALDAHLRPIRLTDASPWRLPKQVWLPVLLILPLVVIGLVQYHFSLHRLQAFLPVVLIIAGIVSLFMCPLFAGYVNGRWAGSHGELPLLALLPGLGNAARVKRATLRACLQPGLCWQAGVIVVAALLGAALQAPPQYYLFLILMGAAGVMLGAAIILNVLGGKPPHRVDLFWWKGAIWVLVVFTAVFGMPTPHDHIAAHGSLWPIAVPAFAWLVWICVLVVPALRGWRALQRRPHPFLANSP